MLTPHPYLMGDYSPLEAPRPGGAGSRRTPLLTLSPQGRGDYRDAILVHQVHPVKLAFDISASVVSNLMLWQHRLAAGLVSRYLLPVVGSALVLGFADLDRLRNTARGRYVLEHMPPASTALRLGGDTLMAVGAWRRKPS